MGEGQVSGGLLTSADDQPTLVSGDGEGHLPARGTPVALAPSTTPAPWGHARAPWRAWRTTLQEREMRANTGGQPGPWSALEGWASPL